MGTGDQIRLRMGAWWQGGWPAAAGRGVTAFSLVGFGWVGAEAAGGGGMGVVVVVVVVVG